MEYEFINRLKVVLAEQRKTNRWLAEQLGKSEITISRWAQNKRQLSVEQLVDIAKVLDVDITTLLNKTKE